MKFLETMHIWRNRLTKKELDKVAQIVHNVNMHIKSPCSIPGYIGEGTFAVVVQLSETKVVRVESDEFDPDFDCSNYHKWIENVVLKFRSSLIPKVYFHARTEDSKDSTLVVTVLEKLNPIGEDEYDEIHNIFYNDNESFYSIEHATKYKLNKSKLDRLAAKMKESSLEMDDIHDENVMIRPSTNQLVITDPCF